MDNLGGGLLSLVITFLFILAVLWFILPFAIFGIKNRLDDLIRETKRTNTLLQSAASARDRSETMYTS